MGRKPKPEHRRRSERIVFLALPLERERYGQMAGMLDKELSEWIRSVLNAEIERSLENLALYEGFEIETPPPTGKPAKK